MLFNACDGQNHIDQYPKEDLEIFNRYVKAGQRNFEEFGKWTSNSDWDRTYYLDQDSLSIEQFKSANEDKEIGHFYEYITDMELKENLNKKDESESNVIFHIKSKILGFSPGYMLTHLFSPGFIDLQIKQYDNLFLSLGTTQVGNMSTVVYNKSNGIRFGSFSNKEYDRNFLQGHLIEEIDSVDDVRAVLVIGDSIYYEDFSKEYLFSGLLKE